MPAVLRPIYLQAQGDKEVWIILGTKLCRADPLWFREGLKELGPAQGGCIPWFWKHWRILPFLLGIPTRVPVQSVLSNIGHRAQEPKNCLFSAWSWDLANMSWTLEANIWDWPQSPGWGWVWDGISRGAAKGREAGDRQRQRPGRLRLYEPLSYPFFCYQSR